MYFVHGNKCPTPERQGNKGHKCKYSDSSPSWGEGRGEGNISRVSEYQGLYIITKLVFYIIIYKAGK